MDRWVGRVALVTGASEGIGADVAKELVNHGLKVVGVARRVELIEKLQTELKGQKGTLYPLKADVSNESDILKVFDWIKNNLGGVDILINNAAISGVTPLADGTIETFELFRKIFELNVIGLSICTREAIKSMKERNVDDGHIINLNSMAGHYVLPFLGRYGYSAAKHAVTVLTEGLRRELVQQKSKIRVTSVSPGVVETQMFRNRMKERIKAGLPLDVALQPKDITDGIIFALAAPPHVQVHEMKIRPLGEDY